MTRTSARRFLVGRFSNCKKNDTPPYIIRSFVLRPVAKQADAPNRVTTTSPSFFTAPDRHRKDALLDISPDGRRADGTSVARVLHSQYAPAAPPRQKRMPALAR